ncbi:hypothetical protein BJ165DRAFT_1535496 [Panaeolus papilionaceus]|nr:hypothetical protein BJ165DRAFT_1535496 [Panaeolus papilionaceus]
MSRLHALSTWSRRSPDVCVKMRKEIFLHWIGGDPLMRESNEWVIDSVGVGMVLSSQEGSEVEDHGHVASQIHFHYVTPDLSVFPFILRPRLDIPQLTPHRDGSIRSPVPPIDPSPPPFTHSPPPTPTISTMSPSAIFPMKTWFHHIAQVLSPSANTRGVAVPALVNPTVQHSAFSDSAQRLHAVVLRTVQAG